MNFIQLCDYVYVQRLETSDTTPGGRIIPDTAKEKPLEGKVIAVSSGKVLDDGTLRGRAVKEGDRILFGKYCGPEVNIDGDKVVLVRDEDILGVYSN
jgi:chaperonin GroES